eukprot:COSAG02_NODE_2523_length_8608_cov_10.605124_6_plen_554_part_00
MQLSWLLSLLTAATASAARGAPPPSDGGAFGRWDSDEHGLPVFVYTLDQDSAEGGVIAGAYGNATTFPAVRNASDHTFLFGNDRVTVVSSNYGYVQLRQDEGAPKLLNDINRSDSQFGASNGIVSDPRTGEVLVSTWAAVDGERSFGVGYRRVRRSSAGCSQPAAGSRPSKCVRLDHLAFSPHGDDPVLLTSAQLTNDGNDTFEVAYSEAHSAAMTQLDFFSWEVSQVGEKGPLGDRRLFAATHYQQSFTRLAGGGGGVIEESRWLGLTSSDRKRFSALQKELGLLSDITPWVGSVDPSLGGNRSSLWDTKPPRTFASLLDGRPEDGLGCSARDFWGEGGPEAPALRLVCSLSPAAADPRNGALVLQRRISLAPGESVSIPLLYGYEATSQQDDSAQAVIARYRGRDLRALFAAHSNVRKAEALHFHVSSMPQISREVGWNYGAAAAAWSYDDFFDEHILTQGTAYTYVNGFNSAARDPLQHALPFIFTRPELAGDVLRYTLKEMGTNASATEIPYRYFNRDSITFCFLVSFGYLFQDHTFLLTFCICIVMLS